MKSSKSKSFWASLATVIMAIFVAGTAPQTVAQDKNPAPSAMPAVVALGQS